MDVWDRFNVGQATQWVFANGLEFNIWADPETIGLLILILRKVASLSLYQIYPQQYYLTVNLEDTVPAIPNFIKNKNLFIQ